MKQIALVTIAIVTSVIVWKISEPGNKQYNKYMCATYGLYEDCKTPLPEELRLK